jgi:uncharacterized membrane protein
MSSLLVFAFSDEGGAERMIADMQSLQKGHLIAISDAATVIRKPDGKIKIKQANSLVGAGALGGAFWGMLIGLLFFMPWLGMAVGAVTGALAGKLTDYGIDDSFIKEVGATIRPGHSALFLMVTSMTEDKVIEALTRHKATLLRTNLSHEDEIKLREAFGAAEVET